MTALTREQALFWSRKYDKEEDQYNPLLEKKLGDKLRRTKELTKGELVQIVEWKFETVPGRRKRTLNLLSDVQDDFIRKTTKEALTEQEERRRVTRLTGRYGGIRGVGFALASVILSFYDPENYGVYDIHAWRGMFGKEPKNLFSKFENFERFAGRLREEAKRLNLDARILEKAYFKKDLDRSEGCMRPSQRVA